MLKMNDPAIKIKGARQHNLKNLDLDIPLHRFTVVTGVSGSGKSSLALDTLYAEGQRRYVETFSPYARQFMDRMDRPQVESITGIPPAIAIDRKDPVRTSRSTVGTMTEVTVTPSQRWIPKGMTVRYLKKAGSNLRAVATPASALPETGESGDYPVRVEVRDADDELVFEAEILMWVSAKKPPQ